MAPRKRVSKVVSRETTEKIIIELNDNNTRSITCQTEPLTFGILRKTVEKRPLARNKFELSVMRKLDPLVLITIVNTEEHKRNKTTQTEMTGLGPNVVNKKQAIHYQMDSLRAMVKKRRIDALEREKSRIKELKDKINADPPPPWNVATKMWLEIDNLMEIINGSVAKGGTNCDGDDSD